MTLGLAFIVHLRRRDGRTRCAARVGMGVACPAEPRQGRRYCAFHDSLIDSVLRAAARR